MLTLTATPIPRTLQLALSGVRELSLIATPPVDRLAIRTYVSEFDPVTIREALLREHYRGGQSFYVVPRIADLADVEAFLRDHVPEVTFIVAHGQMPADELDDKMNAFYDGRYDVLLSTTIIESGLDIPAANTLIVERADMFGLAQLYQIRGRVGRSKLRAYAFFMTEPRKKLTPQAEKRLRVLGALDSLGAGFTLASQDLDIRGAGNLLGEEQSGQVREVGFELYQEMLAGGDRQAPVRRARACADDGEWSPQINLGVPVLIPEAYVPDLDVRLGLYRRLSSLERKVELEGFAAELIDRFGPLPPEVETLHARRPHQGALQARRHRPARRRPQGRHRPVPPRQVRQPGRPRAVPPRPEAAPPRSRTTRSSSAATGPPTRPASPAPSRSPATSPRWPSPRRKAARRPQQSARTPSAVDARLAGLAACRGGPRSRAAVFPDTARFRHTRSRRSQQPLITGDQRRLDFCHEPARRGDDSTARFSGSEQPLCDLPDGHGLGSTLSAPGLAARRQLSVDDGRARLASLDGHDGGSWTLEDSLRPQSAALRDRRQSVLRRPPGHSHGGR